MIRKNVIKLDTGYHPHPGQTKEGLAEEVREAVNAALPSFDPCFHHLAHIYNMVKRLGETADRTKEAEE